jgi:Ser-tRNA(Ala) deacylase AlaX
MKAPRVRRALMQEKLWITQPARATCLARVTAVRGDEFTVDRALFAPTSRACRHPQYADEGTVWWDGEKRRLQRVREAYGVWYTLRGTVPDVDAQLQCQLDSDVRDLASRAHTAMHLMLAAFSADAAPLVADPEVRGGGNFRLTFAWPMQPEVLAAALNAMHRAIHADVVVKRGFAPRAACERFVTRQHFQPPDPVPGPDIVPLVHVGDACVYPCDGTHVDRTARIGRVAVAHAASGKDGFVVVVQVHD